ncbi:MAG: 16S rRNA (cytidine(1402)-2'-O)-methyltransferase [Lachnospiraceae bacterium]|nr:16S rRNA (cytidine(1402)-2'-O)-methyltransferase [Lachnospiraceae bacterium]
MSGTLYLVGTPIGNLEDMTFRAVRILKDADLIAAEDTRNSIKLLTHFDIHTPMTSYHEFNKLDKGRELIEKLEQGTNIALITDAGMPGISDPGEELVRMCYEAGIEVTTVPGPTAFASAAVMSGQPCRRLAFEAFLPKDKKERKRVLDEIARETRTILIYEAPHHLKKTLEELCGVLGRDREVTVTREITKRFEEKLKTTLGAALDYYQTTDPRGEYVLVIRGKSKEESQAEQQSRWEELSIAEHYQKYLSEGMDQKAAMKQVALDRGIRKRDVYQELLKEKK